MPSILSRFRPRSAASNDSGTSSSSEGGLRSPISPITPVTGSPPESPRRLSGQLKRSSKTSSSKSKPDDEWDEPSWLYLLGPPTGVKIRDCVHAVRDGKGVSATIEKYGIPSWPSLADYPKARNELEERHSMKVEWMESLGDVPMSPSSSLAILARSLHHEVTTMSSSSLDLNGLVHVFEDVVQDYLESSNAAMLEGAEIWGCPVFLGRVRMKVPPVETEIVTLPRDGTETLMGYSFRAGTNDGSQPAPGWASIPQLPRRNTDGAPLPSPASPVFVQSPTLAQSRKSLGSTPADLPRRSLDKSRGSSSPFDITKRARKKSDAALAPILKKPQPYPPTQAFPAAPLSAPVEKPRNASLPSPTLQWEDRRRPQYLSSPSPLVRPRSAGSVERGFGVQPPVEPQPVEPILRATNPTPDLSSYEIQPAVPRAQKPTLHVEMPSPAAPAPARLPPQRPSLSPESPSAIKVIRRSVRPVRSAESVSPVSPASSLSPGGQLLSPLSPQTGSPWSVNSTELPLSAQSGSSWSITPTDLHTPTAESISEEWYHAI